MQVATGHFNGAAGFPPVGVSYDIGEGLIHGAHNGTRLLCVKMQNLRGAFDGGAHQAERLRVALHLQLEEQLSMESALPIGEIHAVLCDCPSAGHLDTKQQGERQPSSLLNLVHQGGHFPGGETMSLYSPADNRKIQGAELRGLPVPMRGSQDDAGGQALCTIGAERWWMPQILRQ